LYLVDYHIHTQRCQHACGADREYVETAVRQGLKEMGFADHGPVDHESRITNRMPGAELDDYVRSVEALRSQYPQIAIKLGLEVDYAPGWERRLETMLGEYRWDYLIGSVHFMPEWDYEYIPDDKNRTAAEVYPRYFEQVARMAESGLFDILGHIDLPKRGFPALAPPEMTALYQQLAVRLGKAQAVVELNTCEIRYEKHGPIGIYPDEELVRLCYGAGVRFTLGSDAHCPMDVGADFTAACELMKRVKIDRIAIFSGRRLTMTPWRTGADHKN
jgi:histidinol-phosphatase (PHP family)